MMRLGRPCLLLLSCLLVLLLPSTSTSPESYNETNGERDAKFLSLFTVIKFPNTVCASVSSRNGTCYTSSECSAKGGASSGTCASSFGVCCVFENTCSSGSQSENNTYFTSSGISKGSNCRLRVCKCSSSVCQLRLDFESFVLNLPITSAAASGVNGNAGNPGAYSLGGTCATDTFGVSAPGHSTIPTICGTNTGQHIYVPASDQCNVISANIGSTSSATASTAFTIKITQIPCNSPVLPPSGCLQYMYGATSGTLTSFNYQGVSGVSQTGLSQLLANQHYSICVRTERTVCSICYWSTTFDSGFHMSYPGQVAGTGTMGYDTMCGNPGSGDSGAVALGGFTHANGGSYDYVMIPGGACAPPAAITVSTAHPVDRYCSTVFDCRGVTNLVDGAPDGTVCSAVKPFKISVHSDGVEFAHPIAASEAIAPNNAGFNLNYFMKTACLLHKVIS